MRTDIKEEETHSLLSGLEWPDADEGDVVLQFLLEIPPTADAATIGKLADVVGAAAKESGLVSFGLRLSEAELHCPDCGAGRTA